METGILLENGTNELEVLEFSIGDNYYGINVAKIREIIRYQKITPVPNAHPSIEGIFIPRDTMITVVNLPKHLKIDSNEGEGRADSDKDMLILTNFNKLDIGFHVEKVWGIHRLSWEDILSPDSTMSSADMSISTGIINFEDRIIIILDFEKIVTDICPDTGLKVSDIEKLGDRTTTDVPVLIAEDSAFLSKLIHTSLVKAGYKNITLCNNGQVAYNKLMDYKKNNTIKEKVGVIITDIEMPMMDGHRLTKLVKTDEELKHIPVVIFSSLINEEMYVKGEALGADAQLSKPEIGDLVKVIDGLISKRR